MISATFVSIRITPETGRLIQARVAGAGGLEPLPFPIRRTLGMTYRRCDTGAVITQELIDWRDHSYAGTEPQQRPSQTPRLDAGLATMLGLSEAPRPRSWYSRPKPVAEGVVGQRMTEALRERVRATLLPK